MLVVAVWARGCTTSTPCRGSATCSSRRKLATASLRMWRSHGLRFANLLGYRARHDRRAVCGKAGLSACTSRLPFYRLSVWPWVCAWSTLLCVCVVGHFCSSHFGSNHFGLSHFGSSSSRTTISLKVHWRGFAVALQGSRFSRRHANEARSSARRLSFIHCRCGAQVCGADRLPAVVREEVGTA